MGLTVIHHLFTHPPTPALCRIGGGTYSIIHTGKRGSIGARTFDNKEVECKGFVRYMLDAIELRLHISIL